MEEINRDHEFDLYSNERKTYLKVRNMQGEIMKQTICIAGKNNIAVNVLEYCLEKYQNHNSIEIVCIPTEGDKGVNGWQRSLRWYCEQNYVSTVSLTEMYEVENLLFLSVEFDKIIDVKKFRSNKLFNIHFSLLPRYKGMYPSVLPILFCERKTGVTLHRIREGIDTGEIIDQEEIKIKIEDSSLDIYQELNLIGAKIVIKNIEKLLSGEFTCKKQKATGSTYFSVGAIDYKNLSLNLRCTAFQVCNQVRAFAFRPYQLVSYGGSGLIAGKVTKAISTQPPGTVLEENDICYIVSTIDYNVILYKDVLDVLFEAIKNNDNKNAIYYCSCKKIINDRDEHGWTPLIVATYYNNKEMVEWLVENGADIYTVNNNGTNLLMYAKEAYKRTGDNTLYLFYCAKGLRENMKDFWGRDLYYYLKKDGIELTTIKGNRIVK